jgi:hypothetical protein
MKQITLVPEVQNKQDIVDNVNRWKGLGYTHIFLTMPETQKEGLFLAQKFAGHVDYERIKRNVAY